MVWCVLQKGFVQEAVSAAAQNDTDRAEAWPQRTAGSGKDIARQSVDAAKKFPGLKIDIFVTPFELIEFLKHGDRNGDIVFLKVVNATAVVKNDVGVENEKLGFCIQHENSMQRVSSGL